MNVMTASPAAGLIALCFWIFAVPAAAGVPDTKVDAPVAFRPGERLVYQLKWEFVPAGEATLEVLPDEIIGGRPARHFVMSAKTNSVIDKIYKVRERIDAYTDLRMSRTVLYRKNQREGSHRRDIVVRFDWNEQTAVYTNFGNPRDPIALMPGAFDPLAAFYFVRTAGLAPKKVIERPVTDGKTCILGRVAVLEREKIRVNGRMYDTWRTVPDIRHVGGVFEKSRNARIDLWVSADHRHIPIKIQSKVAVGRFVAEIVSDSEESDSDQFRK